MCPSRIMHLGRGQAAHCTGMLNASLRLGTPEFSSSPYSYFLEFAWPICGTRESRIYSISCILEQVFELVLGSASVMEIIKL